MKQGRLLHLIKFTHVITMTGRCHSIYSAWWLLRMRKLPFFLQLHRLEKTLPGSRLFTGCHTLLGLRTPYIYNSLFHGIGVCQQCLGWSIGRGLSSQESHIPMVKKKTMHISAEDSTAIIYPGYKGTQQTGPQRQDRQQSWAADGHNKAWQDGPSSCPLSSANPTCTAWT